MSKPLIHSHSSLKQYETCPFRFYRQRIVKDVADTQSEAGAYGEQMHKALELRVRDGTPLPPNFATYEPLCAFVDAVPGEKHCELKLSITKDLQPVQFFDKRGWLRGVIDVLVLQERKAVIIDWKTGKYRGADLSQAQRNVATVFVHYPHIDFISTRFVYVQDRKIDQGGFYRHDMDHILTPTITTAADIEWSIANNAWPCRPSGLCRQWCPVTDCKHYGKGGR